MGKKRNDNSFAETLALNKWSYTEYLDRLIELATCMFKYENLPDSVDERFLEMTLLKKGVAVYFKDKELGEDLALMVALGGGFDVYGYPLNRRAYAINGYQQNLTKDNSVLIYNNYLHKPSIQVLRLYARRLSELDRTIDVNCKAQRTPVIVTCSEQERLTFENLIMKYEGGVPFIIGTNDLNVKGFSCLRTDAPFNADKIYSLKTLYWNEVLTYLGISNVNVQKKERLISDEVVRNQGGTISSRYSRLESRRSAFEKINRMFGTDVKVNYREDFQYLDEDIISKTLDEDVDDGGVGGVTDE